MNHVTGKDWIEFERRFPSAAMFLRSREIMGESAILIRKRRLERSTGKRSLNRWQRGRLATLLIMLRQRVNAGIGTLEDNALYPL